MGKTLFKICIWVFLMVLYLTAGAQAQHYSDQYGDSLKTIKLKNGSSLNGTAIDYRNGYYTIRINERDTRYVYEKDVESITDYAEKDIPDSKRPSRAPAAAGRAKKPQAQHCSSCSSSKRVLNPPPAEEDMYIQTMGGDSVGFSKQSFSGKEIQDEVRRIKEDPMLKDLLDGRDPLEVLFTGDIEVKEKDKKIQKLLQHPKMQRLIELINQRSNPSH